MASDMGDRELRQRRGDMMVDNDEDSDYDYTGEDSFNDEEDDCDTRVVEEERCRFDWQEDEEEDRFSGSGELIN